MRFNTFAYSWSIASIRSRPGRRSGRSQAVSEPQPHATPRSGSSDSLGSFRDLKVQGVGFKELSL